MLAHASHALPAGAGGEGGGGDKVSRQQPVQSQPSVNKVEQSATPLSRHQPHGCARQSVSQLAGGREGGGSPGGSPGGNEGGGEPHGTTKDV